MSRGGLIYSDKLNIQNTDRKEPNGFVDPTNEVSCTFTDGTRTLEISPTATSFSFYSNGIKFVKESAESIVISNDEGKHYVYYDDSGVLQSTQTFSDDIILKYAIVAILYWDSTNSKQIYFGREYFHGVGMSGATHYNKHLTVGYSLASGGGLGDILTNQNGNDDEDAQFSCEQTVAFDEDAKFTLSARLKTTNIPKYYRTGADTSNIWRIDDTDEFPVITTGTGRAAWNELTGGNWQRTEVGDNNYVLGHIGVSNDTDRPFIVVIGQNDYTTKEQAESGVLTEINDLIIEGLPIEEFKFLGTIILQTGDAKGNSVKSSIEETDNGSDYVDLRGRVITRNGSSVSVTDHNSTANKELADTGVTWGHIDDQAQTIYGVKTFNSFSITPSSAPTTDYQVANKKYVDDELTDYASDTVVFTNKTIDVDSNTVSNIEVDNFKASAIVTESEGINSNDNDTSLPTSAAVKNYIDYIDKFKIGFWYGTIDDAAGTGDNLLFKDATANEPNRLLLRVDDGEDGGSSKTFEITRASFFVRDPNGDAANDPVIAIYKNTSTIMSSNVTIPLTTDTDKTTGFDTDLTSGINSSLNTFSHGDYIDIYIDTATGSGGEDQIDGYLYIEVKEE